MCTLNTLHLCSKKKVFSIDTKSNSGVDHTWTKFQAENLYLANLFLQGILKQYNAFSGESCWPWRWRHCRKEMHYQRGLWFFFFCNDSYLHISSGSSKKSIHCLYVHLTFFQINKWIVNSRKYSLNWCICTSNVKKNEIAKSYYMGIWVWHHFDYFK